MEKVERKAASDLTWDDEVVIVNDLNEDFVRDCIVSNIETSVYKNLSRREIREKYFDNQGGLLILDYPELESDLEFIYFVIQNGFCATVNCVVGYLCIE